jgi:hypothetical protein
MHNGVKTLPFCLFSSVGYNSFTEFKLYLSA